MWYDKQKVVEHNGLSIEYFVSGKGPNWVICLHGHGRNASDFSPLAISDTRILSLHLFHHGNSHFPLDRIEHDPLQVDEFNALFQLILEEENIQTFHLYAFSQGGRFALCLIPQFVDIIKSVTLVAPDGLNDHTFFNRASRQKWIRKMFIRWEKKHHILPKYLKIASALHLVRPKVKSFISSFIENEELFKKASYSWRTFREIRPNPLEIGQSVKSGNIHFRIIVGKYDQIIQPKQAHSFIKKAQLSDCIITLENGHNFFKSSAINKLLPYLPFIEH
jgi:pimeloyl-ACP methyl ester carboxylesterase